MREITCEELHRKIDRVRIVDVRTPEEFVGELGHIQRAELVPMGPGLVEFLRTLSKDEEVVFVCRSGARSGQTTLLSEEMGHFRTFNMTGGMLRWNELGFHKES